MLVPDTRLPSQGCPSVLYFVVIHSVIYVKSVFKVFSVLLFILMFYYVTCLYMTLRDGRGLFATKYLCFLQQLCFTSSSGCSGTRSRPLAEVASVRMVAWALCMSHSCCVSQCRTKLLDTRK